MKGSTLLWIIMSVLLSYTLYLSYENSKQIKALQQENAELLARVDNTEQTALTKRKPINRMATAVKRTR